MATLHSTPRPRVPLAWRPRWYRAVVHAGRAGVAAARWTTMLARPVLRECVTAAWWLVRAPLALAAALAVRGGMALVLLFAALGGWMEAWQAFTLALAGGALRVAIATLDAWLVPVRWYAGR